MERFWKVLFCSLGRQVICEVFMPNILAVLVGNNMKMDPLGIEVPETYFYAQREDAFVGIT